MVDLAALRAELLNDPDEMGYADYLPSEGNPDNAQDFEIERIINEKRFRGPVPIIDLSAYCTIEGITGLIEATAHDQESTKQVRTLMFSVLSILRDDLRLNTADLDSPAFGYMTGGLIGLGIMSEEQRDALYALGENRRSRAQILFDTGDQVGTYVGVFEIGSARNLEV